MLVLLGGEEDFFPSTGRQQAKSERLATGLLGSKVTFFDVPLRPYGSRVQYGTKNGRASKIIVST